MHLLNRTTFSFGLFIALTASCHVLAAGDDAALKHLEAGKTAFDRNEWKLAADHFDKAILDIESVYGKDAAKARELFSAEKDKPFRGENHERAMAFYYRGLLDLINADYENARASFESALLQDSLSLHGDFSQDFASFEFLSGWASRCAKSEQLASASFKRAAVLNPMLAAPSSSDKTLIIGEAGNAPVKYARQEASSNLQYARHPYSGEDYYLSFGTKQAIPFTESLYYQAISRGPRAADSIASGKLAISREALAVSDELDSQSVSLLGSGGGIWSLVLGGAALGGAAAAASVANSIDAAADTRQWRNMPGVIFLAPSHQTGTALKSTIKLQPIGAQAGITTQVQILNTTPSCQVVRIHERGRQTDEYSALQATLNTRHYPLMK